MGCEQSTPIANDEKHPPATTETCCGDDHHQREFTYRKNTCALEYWEPLRLLGEGSISSIHLVRRRPQRIDVPYKEKVDIMRLAENASVQNNGKDNDSDNEQEVYAMKSIMKDHVRNDQYLEEMRSEIYTMSRLNHTNIVSVYEAFERKRHIYLIMEFCRGGDMRERNLTEPEAATVVRKLLLAVAYMHNHNVVHRDLKLENIMFDKDPKDPTAEIKVIDFGLATKFLSNEYKQMTARVGTLYSMAPQVLQGVYDAKCDIWSVGVIAYILLSGNQPFYGPPREMSWEKRKKIMIDRIMRCEYMKMRGPSWSKISPEAKTFVESMLQMVPRRRPTAEEALKHPWILKHENYQPTNGMPAQNQQYAKKLQLKRMVHVLLAQELEEDEIVQLKTALGTHDPNEEDRITLQHFRDCLWQTKMSPDQVESLFSDKELDLTEYMNYIGLLNDALDRKERAQEELIMDVFAQCGTKTCCTISKDRLRELFEKREGVSKGTLIAVLSVEEGPSVSCDQVVARLRNRKMSTLEMLCSCRVKEEEEKTSDELVDVTNAVIPGGRRESNADPKFVYDDESKSIRMYRPGEDLAKSTVSA